MDVRLIIAIIRHSKLEQVERKLQEVGVNGINVSKVKGYGEYHNFFSRTWMVENVKIEIFTRQDRVKKVAEAIMKAAHTGEPGDGIIGIVPVENFLSIRTQSEVNPAQYWPPS